MILWFIAEPSDSPRKSEMISFFLGLTAQPKGHSEENISCIKVKDFLFVHQLIKLKIFFFLRNRVTRRETRYQTFS